MSGDNGAVSSPDDIRKHNRHTLVCPSGLTLQIRKLTGMDFLEMGQFPLVSGNPKATADDYRKKLEGDPKTQLHQLRLILTKGIVAPKVVDAPPSDCPKDAVSVYDLAEVNWIVVEILKFSGLTEETARAAGPFPKESGVQDR